MNNIRIITCQYLMKIILWLMPNDEWSYNDLDIEFSGGISGIAGDGECNMGMIIKKLK